ncbi:hypothetical protein J2W22_004420 [Sphingomonas kyeonggiensis]|nr:hypothetical protein [Sphingomonas kyeonggiensis]MDQ0252332.1 hypothetical protein [Sphingomonas kyeonggiensis]
MKPVILGCQGQARMGGALDRIVDLLHELSTIDWPRAMGWNGI